MNDLPDRDLRERFAALREEDAAGAPSFRATRAAAQSPLPRRFPRPGSLIPAVATVVLLLLAGFLILRPRNPRQPLVSLAVTRWESPTDFLLQVPGGEYLSAVPRLTFRFTAIPNWRNP